MIKDPDAARKMEDGIALVIMRGKLPSPEQRGFDFSFEEIAGLLSGSERERTLRWQTRFDGRAMDIDPQR